MERTGTSWAEIRKDIDLPMLLCAVALFFLGVIAIYSSRSENGPLYSSYAVKQLMWGGVSVFAYAAVLRIGYRRLISVSWLLYAVTSVALLILLAAGYTSKGAQSWFNFGFIRFQPSEAGKVVLALFLARLSLKVPLQNAYGILRASIATGGIIFPVMLQPDIGSSLVYAVMFFAVLIVGGAPEKFLAGLLGACIAALPMAWLFLKPYQKMRLLVFIDPTRDSRGAGYNVIQSRIAVGSGGIFGKGFLQGTQGKLHFLPESHTDFIFSIYAEEFGFIGCILVLLLFALLLYRMLLTASRTKDFRGKVLITALTAWIWLQLFECVAMSMGLAPVTGLPLPLFSYGGSALLSVAVGLALVQSVSIVSKEEEF